MRTMCNFANLAFSVSFVAHFVAGLLPPPSVSNVSLIIENDVCADKTPFLALFVVLSHTGSIKERQLIRDTYPAEQIEKELKIRRVFILASLKNDNEPNSLFKSITDSEVREENDVYADMIQLNSTEEYRKLTFKSLAAFTWASRHCQHARFIVKTDDNVVLDYYTAATHLKAVEDKDVDAIRGYIYYKEPPQRSTSNWKHYTSYEEYPDKYYPDFAATVYATSPETLKLLVETSKVVPFLNSEDVYFTGLVADKANVTRVDYKSYIGSDSKNKLNCCISGRGKVYACQYFLLKDSQYHHTSRMLLQKYKNHGRYCFFHHCDPFSDHVEHKNEFTCI